MVLSDFFDFFFFFRRQGFRMITFDRQAGPLQNLNRSQVMVIGRSVSFSDPGRPPIGFVGRAMAIARLTHLHLTIPSSGSVSEPVPEECYPVVPLPRESATSRRVSFTQEVAVIESSLCLFSPVGTPDSLTEPKKGETRSHSTGVSYSSTSRITCYSPGRNPWMTRTGSRF